MGAGAGVGGGGGGEAFAEKCAGGEGQMGGAKNLNFWAGVPEKK